MRHIKFYCAGTTQAVFYASRILRNRGVPMAVLPDLDVTDVLLDVPSYNGSGNLRNGEDPEILFSRLSPGTRIWGGKLREIEGMIPIDLLQDASYLAENAAITADCALKIAAPLLTATWKDSRICILGWGRIGKQLSKTLKALGASVSVFARKPSDRALLRAFGYIALGPEQVSASKESYDLIINTVPAKIVGVDSLISSGSNVAIDLASVRGLSGEHVLEARGLPGKLAPRTSGKLIAETILRCGKELF